MRIPRCFVESSLAIGSEVALPASACEHLLRVLRLSAGAELILCNGDGNDYRARLENIGKRGATATVFAQSVNATQSPLRIVLVQALARGEKMDWIVQKATELGVSAIMPVITERTEVRLDEDRAQRRLAHWRAITIAACEQCGRADVPTIATPVRLADYLAGITPRALRLTLDPDGEPAAMLASATADPPLDAPIHFVVGPEGGLSDRDLAQLRAVGFRGLRLGPRILRTETAGLAAITALQVIAGDFR